MTASVQQKLRPGHVSTLQAVAQASGASRRTVSDWSKMAGFPREEDGSYSIWKIAQWNALRNAEPQRNGSAKSLTSRLKREKIALENAERSLKLRQRAGELISLRAVLKFLCQFVHDVNGRLDSIPAEATAGVPPDSRAEVTAGIQHRVGLIQRDLRGLADRMNGELGNGPAPAD